MTFEAIGETWANFAALVQNETDEDLLYVEVTYNIIGAGGSPVANQSSIITTPPPDRRSRRQERGRRTSLRQCQSRLR